MTYYCPCTMHYRGITWSYFLSMFTGLYYNDVHFYWFLTVWWVPRWYPCMSPSNRFKPAPTGRRHTALQWARIVDHIFKNSVHVDQTTNGWLFTCINIIYVVINGCVWAAVQPLGYSLKFVSWNTGRKREMVRPGCDGHGFRTFPTIQCCLHHTTTGIYCRIIAAGL